MGAYVEKLNEKIWPSRDKIRSHTEEEEEETISYFKNERFHLVQILDRVNNNLKESNVNNLDDLYINYFKNESFSKRKIKSNMSKCYLIFMFYIISPLFTVINLIGLFQIKSIMEILFNTLKIIIVNYFMLNEDKKEENKENKNITDYFYFSNYTNNTNNTIDFDIEKYNFYKSLYEQTYDRTINFDLLMLMNFLGLIMLKSCGFSISTIIFLIVNGIALFMAYNFDFGSFNEETKKFSFFKILYLIGCFLILFIGVGASTLLSQQILADSFTKLEELEKNVNSNNNSNHILNDDNSISLDTISEQNLTIENKEELIGDNDKQRGERRKR